MSNKLNYLDKKGLAKVFSLIKFGHKKIWHGTLAEWEALDATEKAKYDQAEVIDEYTGVPVVVDKVESGNLNPVTSNAVAEARNKVGTMLRYKLPASSWASNTTGDINFESRSDGGAANVLPKGRWLLELDWLAKAATLSVTDVAVVINNQFPGINLRGVERNEVDYMYSLSACGSVLVDSDASIKLHVIDVNGNLNGDISYWGVKAIKLADY